MSIELTVMGAGGKMGLRIVDRLADDAEYDVRYVEPDEDGRERLRERGLEPMPAEAALPSADVVVMAVPDAVIGAVCEEVVAETGDDTLVMLLDPAAAHAGVLPEHEGVAYFVAHPCHPPLFAVEADPAAQRDLFGGQGLAEQNVVCALESGDESDYELGERVARDVYAPVATAHRVTTEQMAVLEPALVETVTATLLYAMREALERTVEMGVPEEAARDFLYGHLRTEAAIVFGETDFPLSDAAQRAVEEASDDILADGWRDRVFDRKRIRRSVAGIAGAER